MDLRQFKEELLHGREMYTAREVNEEVIIECITFYGYENYTDYEQRYDEEKGEYIKEEYEYSYPVFKNDHGDTFVANDFDEIVEGFGFTADEAEEDMYEKTYRLSQEGQYRYDY